MTRSDLTPFWRMFARSIGSNLYLDIDGPRHHYSASTANALGLTIQEMLLATADEVIQ
jgi:hypothetical protein